MSLLKTLGGALVLTLLSVSPALAQYGYGGPVVRVRMAPPAAIVERIPIAPSPRHFWTAGHWQWNGGRYAWTPGYYQVMQPGQVWVAAHWTNVGGEYVYEPGHWSDAGVQPVYAQPVQPVYQPPPQPVYQPPPQPVYEQPAPVPVPVYDQQPQPIDVQIAAAPPPPQVEVIPVAPSPNHIWIGGYWGWRNGAHFWYPGRYELRRPGMMWQSPSWVRWGGGWRHTPGYWRRY
jgi:hypothetical protein